MGQPFDLPRGSAPDCDGLQRASPPTRPRAKAHPRLRPLHLAEPHQGLARATPAEVHLARRPWPPRRRRAPAWSARRADRHPASAVRDPLPRFRMSTALPRSQGRVGRRRQRIPGSQGRPAQHSASRPYVRLDKTDHPGTSCPHETASRPRLRSPNSHCAATPPGVASPAKYSSVNRSPGVRKQADRNDGFQLVGTPPA
jgi:hypothetical protein